MKKTVNINLAGQPFIIDEDAYDMLSDYLLTLRQAFVATGESDITPDIEIRMAELFEDALSSSASIITITDVENVIERIGRPETILEEIDGINITGDSNDKNFTKEEPESLNDTSSTPPPLPIQKRLYRDPSNRLLGGVCSGLSWYLGIDPVWMRLITVGLCFLSFSVAGIAYLVLWIIVPEANTPYERLQMMGESPSMDNIGKMVTDNYRDSASVSCPSDNKAEHRLATTLTQIASLLGKCIMAVIAVISVPVVFTILITLLVLAFVLLVFNVDALQTVFPQWNPDQIYWAAHPMVDTNILCAIGWLMTAGIPAAVIGWMCFKGLSGRPGSISKGAGITLTAFFLAGLLTAVITTMTLGIHDYEPFEFLDYDNYHREIPEACDTDNAVDHELELIDESIDSIFAHADRIVARADSISSRALQK